MSREHFGYSFEDESLAEGLCISHNSLGCAIVTNNPQISVAWNRKVYYSCYKCVACRFCFQVHPLRSPGHQGLHYLECFQTPRQGEEHSAGYAVALTGSHSRVIGKSKSCDCVCRQGGWPSGLVLPGRRSMGNISYRRRDYGQSSNTSLESFGFISFHDEDIKRWHWRLLCWGDWW